MEDGSMEYADVQKSERMGVVISWSAKPRAKSVAAVGGVG